MHFRPFFLFSAAAAERTPPPQTAGVFSREEGADRRRFIFLKFFTEIDLTVFGVSYWKPFYCLYILLKPFLRFDIAH
jgi:hypothetical protein